MSWNGKLLSFFVGACPVFALAQFVNPGFESTPNFTGWSTKGDAQIEGSSLGSGPTEGSKMALLATATDGTVNGNVVAGVGTTSTNVETALNVASGSIGAIAGGHIALASSTYQILTLAAGDKVSFDWDFLTNETYNDGTSFSVAPNSSYNDVSFFSLASNGGASATSVTKLADTFYGYSAGGGGASGFTTGLTLTALTNPFIAETGFHTATFTVTSGGSYIVGVGVGHMVATGSPETGINSAVLVDNFKVSSVPEPMSMVGLSLAGVALLRKVKRKS